MKITSRIVAILLVFALCVQMLPVSVLAAESTTSQTPEPDPVAYVTGEIEELRTANEKHFRLSDGTYIAVNYGMPVHYETQTVNGTEWNDIDNTLSINSTKGVYEAKNGTEVKTFAAELTPDEPLFSSSWENYSVSMSLMQASTAESMKAASKENLASSLSLSEAARASKEDTALAANAEEPVIEAIPAQVIDNTGDEPANNEETSIAEQVELPNFASTILYPDFLPDVDLQYDAYGQNIKESILINSQQDAYSYRFFLELTDLTPILKESGAIALANVNGDEIYMIPAPYMIDDEGVFSDDVHFSLEAVNGGYLLTVTASEAWINEDDRAFPVTIDPALILLSGGTQDDIVSNFVKEQNPTQHCNGSQLYMGNNGGSGKNMNGYLYFKTLPTIPTNCSVVGASFSLHKMGYSHVGLPKFYGQVHEVTGSKPSSYSAYTSWIYGITWNTAPSFSDTVEDYAELYPTGNSGKDITWDISRLVCKWYDEGTENRTIAITPYSPNGFASNRYACAAFYTFTGTTQHRPKFIVQYRNNVGLEGHYTYQTVDAGRAGTGYVGDYTSQFTLANTIVSSSSNTLPLSITAYFNSANRNTYFTDNEAAGIHSVNYTGMKVGAGWKLSIQESIRLITVSTRDASLDYYVYNDADGSEHYFQKSGMSSPYKDEDGLGFELTVSGTTFTLKDQKDNQKVFYNGYLGKILDANGNAIYLLYNGKEYSASNTLWQPTSGTANYVSKIVRVNDNGSAADIVTTLFNFSYSGGFLQYIEDAAGNRTLFGYKNVNNLQRMFRFTYPDGKRAEYSFDSATGSMLKAYDCEAQVGVGFTYRTFLGTLCVQKVREFAAATIDGTETVGSQWHLWVYDRGLKEYRFYGPDQAPETSDDTIARYVFDHTGKTVTITNYDYNRVNILGVTNTSYTSNANTKTKNRVSGASATGYVAVNLLNNSGFENESNTGNYKWTLMRSADISATNAAIRTKLVETSPDFTPRTGAYLLKTYITAANVSATSSNSYAGMYQRVYLQKNVTYIFSGWASSTYISSFGMGGGMLLQFCNDSGATLKESELINYNTSIDINGGWTRLEVSYTPEVSGWYRVCAVQRNACTVGAFDDLQLEVNKSDTASSGASTANLVQLGSLELWNGTTADRTQAPVYWTYDTSKATPNANGALSGYSMYILGKPTEKRRASQIIPINKPSDTTFVLTAWGKATSAPGCAYANDMTGDNDENKRFFGLIAKINYSDNSDPDYNYLVFDCNYTGWQYGSATVAPKKSNKTVSSIEISTAYDYNINEARFDNISLVEEPAQTYTYDENGNLKSVTSTGNGTDSYTYSGADLTKEVAGGYGTYTYTYDSAHNMTSAVNGDIKMTADYDAAGNATGTQIKNKNNSNSLFLKTSSTATTDLDHTKTVTDANGGYTSYNYDTIGRNTSKTVKQTSSSNVTTSYDYFTGSDRQSASGIANVAKLVYGYTRGSLTDFSRHALSGSSRPWQQYHMVTDDWGNVTSIQVRSSASTAATAPSSWSTAIELAKYDYAGNNGYLNKMTYGNGDYETYTYDRYGRTDTVNHYNAANVLQYSESFVYDGSGNTAKSVVKDASGNEIAVYRYEYDSLGRMIRSKQSGSSITAVSTEHLYDQENRLTQQSYQLGGTGFTETYTYDSTGDGSMTEMTTTSGSTLTLAYDTIRRLQTLTAKNGNSTLYTKGYAYRTISGQQTTTQISALNYSGFANAPSFQYAYNADGTIASEGESNNTPRCYSYDKLGQLTFVSDDKNDLHYSYNYDSAGNITSVSVQGVYHNWENYKNTYTYGNASWADLLTAFNGQNIAYEGQSYNSSTGTVTGTVKSGNPISYYNGSRWTFSWQNGRQLASASKSGTSISYTYDLNSLRTSKTVNGVQHNYVYASGKLLRETYGSTILDFSYALNGAPYSLTYTNGSASPVTYYYITNVQNDVINLVDASGTKVAEYKYDPFGKVITASGSMAETNPIRYRGYYYDTETGFYYLQARYYDPTICRFINADFAEYSGTSSLGDCNLFAYCGNNPVNNDDQDGEFWNIVVGALIGGVVNLVSSYVSAKISGDEFTLADGLTSFATGALSGGLSATGIGVATATAINTVAAGVGSVVADVGSGREIDWVKAGISAGSAFLSSKWSGNGIRSMKEPFGQAKAAAKAASSVVKTTARGAARKAAASTAKKLARKAATIYLDESFILLGKTLTFGGINTTAFSIWGKAKKALHI